MNTLIAAISGQDLVHAVVWIIAAGLIYFILEWLLSKVGLPEPFSKIARIVVAVVAALILINAILGLAGSPVVKI